MKYASRMWRKTIVCCLVFAFFVHAGSVVKASGQTTITIPTLQAKAGDELFIPVQVKDNQGFASFIIDVTYDKKILTPISVEKDQMLKGMFVSNLDYQQAQSMLREAYVDTTNTSANGTLFTLKFKINGDIQGTQAYTLDIKLTEFYDTDLKQVQTQLVNNPITLQGVQATDKPVDQTPTPKPTIQTSAPVQTAKPSAQPVTPSPQPIQTTKPVTQPSPSTQSSAEPTAQATNAPPTNTPTTLPQATNQPTQTPTSTTSHFGAGSQNQIAGKSTQPPNPTSISIPIPIQDAQSVVSTPKTPTFIDVAPTEDYFEAVEFVAAKGIAVGTGNHHFSPLVKLNRAQFVMMTLHAFDITIEKGGDDNFSDANGKYYTDAIATAKRLGLIAGVGDNRFEPERSITRQEMYVMLYQAMDLLDKEFVTNQEKQPKEMKRENRFTDLKDVSTWAQEDTTFFIQLGTMVGDGAQILPKEEVTRADMASMFYQLSKLYSF